MKQTLTLVLLASAVLLAGCQPVQAWQRGYLAREEMAIDADPMARTLDQHVYFSKEASSGGNSASGGGCGCN